jgi:hypothetical protein
MFEMRFVAVRKSFSEKPSDMVIETVEVSISEEAGSADRAVGAGEKIESTGQEPLLRGSRQTQVVEKGGGILSLS